MNNKSSDYLDGKLNLSETTTYQAGVVQSTMSRLLKKFSDNCLKEHGITTMQWFVIGTIYDSGKKGMRISELSDKLDTNMPYITNTMNLLESKGIVVREGSTTDNRSRLVKISPEFEPRCKVIEKDLRQKMRDGFYSHVNPNELQIYLSVIHKLSKLSAPE
jgi:DNA-binding MarR family transcriptional regulator